MVDDYYTSRFFKSFLRWQARTSLLRSVSSRSSLYLFSGFWIIAIKIVFQLILSVFGSSTSYLIFSTLECIYWRCTIRGREAEFLLHLSI